LSDLRVFEISLVDKSANNRKFLMFKRLSDPTTTNMDENELAKKLETEWEQADETEKQKVLLEINRLDALLSLMILEKHLSALDPSIRKRVLADEGGGWDYNPETGAFTKSEKAKLTPLEGSEPKSHVFNFENGKWEPKRHRRQ
jgi:hypothetical protein